MKQLFLFLFILSVICACSGHSQVADKDRINQHIHILAHDSLQGRGTATPGEAAAAAYIISEFKKLNLEPRGDNGFLQKFPFNSGPHGGGVSGNAHNIAARLDNQSNTTIVIGAHYDHLGTGTQGGSLDANPHDKIHNGADDNASGVAGVIELARHFSSNNRRENNNFLFLCFSGEEMGLLGSKYFTENPTIDLSTVNFMINLDMIGRLNPTTRALTIYGTGTSAVWHPLMEGIKADSLVISTDSSGTGPSDHTSFYLKKIPVLHFFTGSHPDYHKPTDDVEKINIKGTAEVLNYIAELIESADNQPKLDFLPTKNKMQNSQTTFKVTLGIMPNYASTIKGVQVDGVTEGRPAHRAGIKAGDVIIRMGEHEIHDIYEYMEALGKFEEGQKTSVTILRDKKALEVSVEF